MSFLQVLDKTEVLWGEINVPLKLSRPTSSESMFLSLELCTLISCNNKGPKLNDLLIQDLTFPQFSITLPSQEADVNLMHTHSVTLNLRKAAVFLYNIKKIIYLGFILLTYAEVHSQISVFVPGVTKIY